MIPVRDKTPADLFPVITISIIVANVAMFAYQVSSGARQFEQFTAGFAVIPATFVAHPFSPSQYTLVFTSMFLHGGLLHLAGNMLFLWIFGNNVEDYFGHIRFAVFYLCCGVAATLAHIFVNSSSGVPVIGASGAISGVLGAYFLLFPKARVVAVIPVFFFLYFLEVPAYFFLGVYILLQLLYALPTLSGGPAATHGIAWFAHIGGFVAGIVLLYAFNKRRGFRKRESY